MDLIDRVSNKYDKKGARQNSGGSGQRTAMKRRLRASDVEFAQPARRESRSEDREERPAPQRKVDSSALSELRSRFSSNEAPEPARAAPAMPEETATVPAVIEPRRETALARVFDEGAPPRRTEESPQAQVRKKSKAKGKKSREFKMDFERLKKFSFITPGGRRSRTSEEFRLIKRRLMQRMTLERRDEEDRSTRRRAKKARGRDHVILVSSARPSEGKSFVAVNLALSIVLDEGLNVLLIDADVARPAVSRIFGLRSDLPGLTDLLAGEKDDVASVMLREKKYPLSFLPAGGAVASATDLFGSERMHSFIRDVADRYPDRIIIFDAPPLLASTEPVVLSQHAGQIVMVVDAEKTSRSAVDSALDLLETDENVNLVLNKATNRSSTEQFGSYYEAYTQD